MMDEHCLGVSYKGPGPYRAIDCQPRCVDVNGAFLMLMVKCQLVIELVIK